MSIRTLISPLPASIKALLLMLAGGLITLSLAPFDYWPLAIIAILIFQQSLQNVSAKTAMWRGLYFAFGLQLSGNFWIYVSIHDHGGANAFLASIMTVGLCVFLASWLMPLSYAYVRFIRHKPLGNTLGFTAMWIISEWLKTWLLTGFPWLFLGYSQLHAPLHAWIPILGTFGVSMILAYTATVIGNVIDKKAWQAAIIVVLLLWLAPLYLKTLVWTHAKSNRAYTVALLQPNTLLEEKWDPRFHDAIMQDLEQTTLSLQGTDIIVWPETAVPDLYHNAYDELQTLSRSAEQTNSAIILGIASKWYENKETVYHNSITVLGQGSGMYHKQQLVPFGEYVPLESWLRGIIRFFDLPLSSFRPGAKNQEPLEAQNLIIMPYICYEVVYPNFVAQTASKADVLLTISNDAWFGTSIGPIQHMQMAQMRALENGRYMIRDTNNGITAIINTNGDIVTEVPSFQKAVLKGTVYAYQGLTPVASYGTLPPVIFSLLLLLLLWRLPQKPEH